MAGIACELSNETYRLRITILRGSTQSDSYLVTLVSLLSGFNQLSSLFNQVSKVNIRELMWILFRYNTSQAQTVNLHTIANISEKRIPHTVEPFHIESQTYSLSFVLWVDVNQKQISLQKTVYHKTKDTRHEGFIKALQRLSFSQL